mgnify:CR=1 FL=1
MMHYLLIGEQPALGTRMERLGLLEEGKPVEEMWTVEETVTVLQ